jgi:hypothetical protein
VVGCLKAHRVEMAFSVADESDIDVLDALYDAPGDPPRDVPPGRRRGVILGSR